MSSDNPMVGGAAMYKNKTFIENLRNSSSHTTLIAAIKSASLVETLSAKGPYTVFAPTNSAFEELPTATVDMLLIPENKSILETLLTYHIIAGRLDTKSITKAIKKGKGSATFTTIEGQSLTAFLDGDDIILQDVSGEKTKIEIADVKQANGIIHVIDKVLNPASIYHGNLRGQVVIKSGKSTAPVNQVTVELVFNGKVKITKTTDADGWYAFDKVSAVETYLIRINGESKTVKSVIDKTVTVPTFMITQ